MKAENSRKSCGFGGEVKLKKIMKCIFFGKQVRADEAAESLESSLATRDYSASGHSAQAGEVVVKNSTNPSTIEEAESSLRASGYLNYESSTVETDLRTLEC